MSLNLNLIRLHKKVEKKKSECRWLENLTSTVSHEMRTPLSVIIQTAEHVTNNLTGQQNDIKSQIRMIYLQAQFMLFYVNDLLDLKQIKHGVFKSVVRIFDPNETLQYIIDMFKIQA